MSGNEFEVEFFHWEKRSDCRPVSNSFGDAISYHKGIDSTNKTYLPQPLQFFKHISSIVSCRGSWSWSYLMKATSTHKYLLQKR